MVMSSWTGPRAGHNPNGYADRHYDQLMTKESPDAMGNRVLTKCKAATQVTWN